jgi:hypothetical protein
MEIPEHLRDLVDHLGRALVQALVTDEACRDLARQIQESGFEVGLMIEATLALQRRDEATSEADEEQDTAIIQFQSSEDGIPLERPGREKSDSERLSWSDEDRAFLRKFKISLD